MRLSPVAKINLLMASALLIASASPAFAQAVPPTYGSTPYAQQPTLGTGYAGANPALIAQQQAAATALSGAEDVGREAYVQAMREAIGENMGRPPEAPDAQPTVAATPVDLGDIRDKNSARYKSDKLADQAIKRRNAEKDMLEPSTIDMTVAPPPEVETLQMVNENSPDPSGLDFAEDPAMKELSVGMRKNAQKEAAISYGARGGLAKQSFEIMERIKGFDPALDKVFNFRQLLMKAPSGLMIEPPIVKEALDALVITQGGDEAAVAKQVYDINKRAKIVSAPRDWRQYLIQSWGNVPPPPRVLWPKNAEEQKDWNRWVAQGWKAGVAQAEQIFEMNTNRLVADYDGMVRYKVLVAQGMISEPFAMQEDRGVTGDKNQMRVGDSALRITGPSQFLMGADLWKPADR